jgi:hypothetical protein
VYARIYRNILSYAEVYYTNFINELVMTLLREGTLKNVLTVFEAFINRDPTYLQKYRCRFEIAS